MDIALGRFLDLAKFVRYMDSRSAEEKPRRYPIKLPMQPYQIMKKMPELHPIDFKAIQTFSEALEQEVLLWAKQPWSWEDMVSQYIRIHSTQESKSTQPKNKRVY